MRAKFNDSAHTYSQYAVVQRRLAAWLAEWLEPPRHTAALSALELGAGDGIFTQLLAGRFARTTAVDLAPRMVRQGESRLPQVDWHIDDGWQYRCRPVDRLYSASFLHWCDDPGSVLRRWRGLVKHDGQSLHGFYTAPTLVEWQSTAGWSPPVRWRTRSHWEELFREAGWKILRSGARVHQELFSSALAVLQFFHRTGAVIPRRSSIGTLRRILAAIERMSTAVDGRPVVATTWTFLRIEAVNQ
jgi:SAM-dependent methyltransferase